MSKRESYLFGTENHEKLLLREVLCVEPYQFRPGTKERGASWTKIAESLTCAGLKVSQRSVREKFDKMIREFNKKERDEQQASGVAVEYGELDQCLTDIKERIADFDGMRESEDKKQKREKASAEEMRKRATEKMSETKKRKNSSDLQGESEGIEGKRRRSHANVIDVMKESLEFKRKEKEQEQAIRGREIELRAAEQQQQQLFQKSMLQQQQQFQQQQQALNMSMINALGELLKNIKK